MRTENVTLWTHPELSCHPDNLTLILTFFFFFAFTRQQEKKNRKKGNIKITKLFNRYKIYNHSLSWYHEIFLHRLSLGSGVCVGVGEGGRRRGNKTPVCRQLDTHLRSRHVQSSPKIIHFGLANLTANTLAASLSVVFYKGVWYIQFCIFP